MQLEDDIVAKPNYLSTMKNFALQQPSEDWMILEFSQLGFIGMTTLTQSHWPDHSPSVLPTPLLLALSPSTMLSFLSTFVQIEVS